MSERERCGGKPGIAYGVWDGAPCTDPNCAGFCGAKQIPCPGCHDCQPGKWCGHGMEVCPEWCSVDEESWSGCLTHKKDSGDRHHLEDGTPCVPALRCACGKFDLAEKRSHLDTLNHTERRCTETVPAKCPTCGSENGVARVRCKLACGSGPHSEWHVEEDNCVAGTRGLTHGCVPCPTCTAKQEPETIDVGKYGDVEGVGFLNPKYKDPEPKCPVHGEGVCGCYDHRHSNGMSMVSPGPDGAGRSHYRCGCPQEQGSGDAAGSESPARTANKGAVPVSSPDPSPSALAMEAALEARDTWSAWFGLHSDHVRHKFVVLMESIISRAISAAVNSRDERIAELEGALKDHFCASLNEMTAKNLPHEWSPTSVMARTLAAIRKSEPGWLWEFLPDGKVAAPPKP